MGHWRDVVRGAEHSVADVDRNYGEEIADFAQAAAAVHTIDETVGQIVAYGMRLVGADHGGVTLWRSRGRLQSVGATSQIVLRLDQCQYELREGPCVRAAEKIHEVLANDLATDPRWPAWSNLAVALGVRSAAAVELYANNRRLGALNLFGTRRDQFSGLDAAELHTFGIHASVALAAAITEENLQHAVEARTVIGQATGILMHKFGLTADAAVAVLRRYSQDNNLPLRQIAELVINTGDLPLSDKSGTERYVR